MAPNEVALSASLSGVQMGSAIKGSTEVGVDGTTKPGRVGATNITELLAEVFLPLDCIFFMQHKTNTIRIITV